MPPKVTPAQIRALQKQNESNQRDLDKMKKELDKKRKENEKMQKILANLTKK